MDAAAVAWDLCRYVTANARVGVARVGVRVGEIIISTVMSHGNATIANRIVRLGCDRKSGYGRVAPCPDAACVHLSRLHSFRLSISRGLRASLYSRFI